MNHETIFTKKIPKGKEMIMPIAHRQGNYLASEDLLKKLQDNNQIAFNYGDKMGGNPNG